MNAIHVRFAVCLSLLSFVPAFAPNAAANMADPIRSGDPVGEPSPLLDSIHVLYEDLLIDMRPLVRSDPVLVRVSYSVRNAGRSRSLDLLFIAAGLHDSAGAFDIALDGHPIPGRGIDSIDVPVEWSLPAYTPGFGEHDSLEYRILIRHKGGDGFREYGSWDPRPIAFSRETSGILFHISIPEGDHTIVVAYASDASGFGRYGPVYAWQLGYVLSPVRRWASFGRLDATIIVPAEWEAAVLPEMTRSGDTLSGSWDHLPADAIAVSTRLSISPASMWIAEWAPFLFAGIVTLLLSYRLGVRKGREIAANGWRPARAIPVALFTAVLSYLLFAGASVGSMTWTAYLAADQLVPGYSLIIMFLMPALLFVTPFVLTVVVPPVVTMGAAVITARRAKGSGSEG